MKKTKEQKVINPPSINYTIIERDGIYSGTVIDRNNSGTHEDYNVVVNTSYAGMCFYAFKYCNNYLTKEANRYIKEINDLIIDQAVAKIRLK